MEKEVVPVTVKSKKGDTQFAVDEEFTKVNFDKLKQLKAVFQKGRKILESCKFSLAEKFEDRKTTFHLEKSLNKSISFELIFFK